MIQVRFGGALSEVLDPVAKVEVQPRCFGEAQLVVRDANAYDARVREQGGEEEMTQWVARLIVQEAAVVFAELVEARGVLKSIQDSAGLTQAITAAVDTQLLPAGASVQIGNLAVNLSPDDVEALTAAAAKRKA